MSVCAMDWARMCNTITLYPSLFHLCPLLCSPALSSRKHNGTCPVRFYHTISVHISLLLIPLYLENHHNSKTSETGIYEDLFYQAKPQPTNQTVYSTDIIMCGTNSFPTTKAATPVNFSGEVCRTCYNPYPQCCCGIRTYRSGGDASNNYCRTCYEPYSSCCCGTRRVGSSAERKL